MSQRASYPPGVPCWVETLQPDPRAATTFYGKLFGWEFAGPGPMPGDPPGEYFVARKHGADVAGIGSALPATDPARPVWATHIRVSDVDATAGAVRSAGGTVLADPFGVPPAGRCAVIADPSGAVVCLWQAGSREGAQRINEAGAWAMSLLHTPDPAAAGGFYSAVFGWQLESFGPVNLCRLPGYVGGEEAQPVPRDVVAVLMEDENAYWGVDFWIEDAQAGAEYAAANGGSILVAPHSSQPMFLQAVLSDPQGAVFSVSQFVGPG